MGEKFNPMMIPAKGSNNPHGSGDCYGPNCPVCKSEHNVPRGAGGAITPSSSEELEQQQDFKFDYITLEGFNPEELGNKKLVLIGNSEGGQLKLDNEEKIIRSAQEAKKFLMDMIEFFNESFLREGEINLPSQPTKEQIRKKNEDISPFKKQLEAIMTKVDSLILIDENDPYAVLLASVLDLYKDGTAFLSKDVLDKIKKLLNPDKGEEYLSNIINEEDTIADKVKALSSAIKGGLADFVSKEDS